MVLKSFSLLKKNYLFFPSHSRASLRLSCIRSMACTRIPTSFFDCMLILTLRSPMLIRSATRVSFIIGWMIMFRKTTNIAKNIVIFNTMAIITMVITDLVNSSSMNLNVTYTSTSPMISPLLVILMRFLINFPLILLLAGMIFQFLSSLFLPMKTPLVSRSKTRIP